jgi:predicted AlkP superfamily pyrophosphatase or phosphodiesterase
MSMRGYLVPGTVLLVAATAVTGLVYVGFRQPVGSRPAAEPRVKLAVLVVFDQLRGDFLRRWKPLFGRDGFARLQSEGAWFTHCHYPYGTTNTGPGHASMLTGTCPDRHGIISNNWFERGGVVYCAGSDRYELVPPSPGPRTRGRPKEVGTPDRLTAETVADVLKASHPAAKVFGLSLKDRSAILPTGKRPDGVYWFTGRFVTSTYYTDRVHPWVEQFNASGLADRWYGQDWTRLRADVNYDEYAGPDSAAGEGSGVSVREGAAKGWSQGVAFPHPMNPPATPGVSKPGPEYYEALANSPFGNDLLLEFTKACVTAERLGQRDVPDLLVVSFSSNDLVGHTWGPDSHEVLDITLRSDALMADFLAFLDETVGRGRYLIALTADHGVCPLVEVSQAKGIDARRIDIRELQKELEGHLSQRFASPGGEDGRRSSWVEAFGDPGTFPWVYLNPKALAAAGTTPEEVAKVAAAFLARHPAVARAYTRADLAHPQDPPKDVIDERVRRSYHPERAGHVYVVLKEYYLPSKPTDTGTTHGAPYDYDTHVPLIVYGPGVAGGAKDEPVTPQAAAAILARWLGLRPPDRAEFPVPATLTP